MGGKKGGGARTPHIAPNTLESHQKLKVLDLISSGEIYSLEHGDEMPLRSIYLNDTPIQNEDGSLNFKGVRVEYLKGTVDQDYLPAFSSVSTSVNVAAEVKRDQPITRTVVNPEVTSVRVTVGVDALMESTMEGDQYPTSVSMTISIIKNNQYYASQVFSLHEKGSKPYYQDFVFDDLPPAPFSIKCVRNTPDSNNDMLRNKTFFYSYVESIDAKFRYPKLAICGIEVDAEQFGNSTPTRTYGLKGAVVQIPSNYNPFTREYDGLWDRLFKPGYSNNPAWVLYDLLTNEVDGFGERFRDYRIDIDKLYQLAKHCDVMVDDGNGGKEPRFVCNAVIQGNDAHKVLYDVCSTFRGIPVFHNDRFTVYYDDKADISAVYNNANVVDGLFDYSFTSRQDQYNQVQVQYIDKEDGYRTKIDEVSDPAHIEKYGLNTLSITAFGATSRSYAMRMAKWNLVTNLTENEFVSFKVGLEGIRHAIYDIIQIADNDYAGTTIGGRTLSIDGNTITLDRDVENVQSFLIMNREARSISYKVKRRIADNQYQLDKPVDAENYSAFNAILNNVEPRLFRCISITEDAEEGIYTIVAVKHNRQKEAIVDDGAKYLEPNYSVINTLPHLVNGHVSNNGKELILKWDSLEVAGSSNEYRVELLKDGTLYKTYWTKENQLVLTNLPQGEYVARIRARNNNGQFSEELIIAFSTTYKIDGLRTRSIVFGIELHWQLPALIATDAHTEIWYSDVDDRQKVSKLAVLSYPQSNYTLNGLSVGDELYFWFRLVDSDGNQGEFTQSIKGRASDSAEDILGYLQGQITTKELDSSIVDEIIEQASKDLNIDIESIRDDVEKIIEDSEVVSSVNERVDNAQIESQLLELSKLTGDKAVYAETQVNRTSIDDNYSEIVLQQLAEATNNKQLASMYTGLSAAHNESRADFLDFKEVTASDLEATAKSIEKLDSEVLDNSAEILLSRLTSVTGDKQLSQNYLSLVAENELAKAELLLSQLAQATDNKALVQEISSLTASFLDNSASINEIKEVTAGIDGTVKSQYTLTTETVGKDGKKVVSGFTSVNDGKTSEFIVQADKFAIVNKQNGEQKMPFIIANNKLVMDGDMIASGSISGNKLVAGTSIQAPHIVGGNINIGNGNFTVDSNGNMFAKSGVFEGTVYAEKMIGDVLKNYTNGTGNVIVPPEKFERTFVAFGCSTATRKRVTETRSYADPHPLLKAQIRSSHNEQTLYFESPQYTHSIDISSSNTKVHQRHTTLSSAVPIVMSGRLPPGAGTMISVTGEYQGILCVLVSKA